MDRLPFSFYFNPLSCLQYVEGTPAQCREILLHNYAQRAKFSEVGHRWMQISIMAFLLGLLCDNYHWIATEFTLFGIGILLTLPATLTASVWWMLGMVKEDMDRGIF
jgi:hypothetical protein